MSFLHHTSTTFCEMDHPHVADVSMDESLDDAEEGKTPRQDHHTSLATSPAGGDRPNSAWSLQAQPSYDGRHESLSSSSSSDDDGEDHEGVGISFDTEEEIPSWANNVPTLRLQPRHQNNKRGRVVGGEQLQYDMVEGGPITWSGLPSSLAVPFIDETIQRSNKRSKARLHKHRQNAAWSTFADDQEQQSFLHRHLQRRTAMVRPRIVSGGTAIELQGHGGGARRGATTSHTNVFVAAELSPFKAIPSPKMSPMTNKKQDQYRLRANRQNEDPFVTPTQQRPAVFLASRTRSAAEQGETFVLARPQAVRFSQDRLAADSIYDSSSSSSSKSSRQGPSNNDAGTRASTAASTASSSATVEILSSSAASSAFTTPSG